MAYEDRHGRATRRTVEPIALVGSGEAWYLVAHCRLRDAARVFRLDRIAAAEVTTERAPERDYEPGPDLPAELRRLSLLE